MESGNTFLDIRTDGIGTTIGLDTVFQEFNELRICSTLTFRLTCYLFLDYLQNRRPILGFAWYTAVTRNQTSELWD